MTSQDPIPPEDTPPATPRVSPRRFDGKAFDERANAFGREAEAAAQRLSRDPFVVGAADVAARTWGAILLVVGLWFFADVTLGLDLPGLPWSELWPLALILIGGLVVFRGISRRRA